MPRGGGKSEPLRLPLRPLKPRRRKVGQAAWPIGCQHVRCAFEQSEHVETGSTMRSRNRRKTMRSLRSLPPRRNRHRRERRATTEPERSSREFAGPASRRQASSAPRGPHAGESGVSRKAGPISLWGTTAERIAPLPRDSARAVKRCGTPVGGKDAVCAGTNCFWLTDESLTPRGEATADGFRRLPKPRISRRRWTGHPL